MKVKIYVEGGGNDNSRLCAELRQGFQSLFIKAGLEGKLPSVTASGSRDDAFNDFKMAIKNLKKDEAVLLLVDSEDPINSIQTKWQHVKNRDSWDKPFGASEDNLFFMVECMESWFLADKDALKSFYGKDFHEKKLSTNTNLEAIKKTAIYDSLSEATKDTTKGRYGKGTHSFKILATLDAAKVKAHGNFAKDFFDHIQSL